MTTADKLAECRQRCQTVLAWYGMQGCTRMELARILAREPYYLLTVEATGTGCAMIDDVRLVSLTVDGLVLALDAVLRAQLWPAREPENPST